MIPRPARRPRGIALVLTLVVVLLVTMFVSEFFFSTGLELRSLQTYQETHRARSLARSAFKVVLIGLMKDEADFFQAYRQLEQLLQLAAVPWEDGLLIDLKVQPLDALYNLNELYNIKPDSAFEQVRWLLFASTLDQVLLPAPDGVGPPAPPEEALVKELYSAFTDWIDSDHIPYLQLGTQGGENDAYFDHEPEIAVKNAPLDQLTEIRLVKGVVESRIPWSEWEARFAALPKRGSGASPYPEKLNVNYATREEIVRFLEARQVVGDLNDASVEDLQKALNEYANHAQSIAEVLVPLEGGHSTLTEAAINAALSTIPGINAKYAKQVFSTFNQYYRVRLTTEVNDVQARLEAVLFVERNPNRTGKDLSILQFAFQ